MRLAAALLMAAVVAGGSLPRAGAQDGVAAGDRLVGTWSGSWTAEDGRRHGSLDVFITGYPTLPNLLGDFGFAIGSESHTQRGYGLLVRESARFALADGGEIVLRLAGRNRLVGSFVDGGVMLPAARGHVELIRAR